MAVNVNETDIGAYARDGVVCLRGVFEAKWLETVARGIEAELAAPGPGFVEQQEKGKPFFRKVYEQVVDWGAALLENRQRKEVATKAEVSGRLDDPKVSTLEVVLRMLQNAFFKAILPGFDVEAERAAGSRK